MHKDNAESAVCEDCYATPNYPKWIHAKQMKGGIKNGRKI